MLDNMSRFHESRLIKGFVCPYCHSKAVIRWGQERLPVRQVKISQQLAAIPKEPYWFIHQVCHHERSEGSRLRSTRFLAALGMTNLLAFGG
jgi:hypothetical protein